MQQTYKGKKIIWESKHKHTKQIAIAFSFVAAALLLKDAYPPFLFWAVIIFFGGAGTIMLVHILHPKHLFVTADSKLGLEILEEQRRQAQEDLGRFSYTQDGFYYPIHEEERFYKWSDIETVFAHEEDISYNQMCLDLFMNDGAILELTEETPGWYQFKNRLCEQVPLREFVWENEEPGYDPYLTLLYDKKGRTQEAAEEACYPE